MKEYVILCGNTGLAERLFNKFLCKFADLVEYIDRKNLTTKTKDTTLIFISKTDWHGQNDTTVVSGEYFELAMVDYLANHQEE